MSKQEKMDASKVQEKLKKTLRTEGMSEGDAKFISSCVNNMDKNNLKMAKVWAEKGVDEAVKQMFVDPNDGGQLSYSEMRSYYG